MCWYILRHSHFIHFIFYILHQANFQNRKKKYIFDNNYIIIFYIKIECLKQRFWLLLRYLQTYFLPRIYQNVKIINLCVVQTWKVFDQDVYYTVGMGDYRLQRKTKYISADRVYLNFIIGDLHLYDIIINYGVFTGTGKPYLIYGCGL